MKDAFRGYYRPTEEEFRALWEDCVFVLDTNVLFNLYRRSDGTRDDLIDVLRQLSEQDRLWLPYQVADEYQRGRLGVIDTQANLYVGLREGLSEMVDILNGHLASFTQPFVDETLVDGLQAAVTALQGDLEAREQDVRRLIEDDDIRDAITPLFQGRIGPRPSREHLAEMHELAEERYRAGIPPGFRDAKKAKRTTPEPDATDSAGDAPPEADRANGRTPGREYGDAVLWLQIIEHAEKTERPVVLVTDDGKADWWWKQGRRTLGPRPELVQEFREGSGQAFHAYRMIRFMELAKEYLSADIRDDSLAEFKRFAEQDDAERERIAADEAETSAAVAAMEPLLGSVAAGTGSLTTIPGQAAAARLALARLPLGPTMRAYDDTTRKLYTQIYGGPAFRLIQQSLGQMLDNPAIRAQQELVRTLAGSPAFRELQQLQRQMLDNPAIRAQQELVRKLAGSPAFRLLQEFPQQYQWLLDGGVFDRLTSLQRSGALGKTGGPRPEPDGDDPDHVAGDEGEPAEDDSTTENGDGDDGDPDGPEPVTV